MPLRSSRPAPDAARPAPSPALLPRRQTLLAALADIDCAFDGDVATVEASGIPDALKRSVIRSLHARHEARRAPVVQHVE